VVLAGRTEQEVNPCLESRGIRDCSAHQQEEHARDREADGELPEDLGATRACLSVEREPRRDGHRKAEQEDPVRLILGTDRERAEEHDAPEATWLATHQRAHRLEQREACPEEIRNVEVARVRVVRERCHHRDDERDEQRCAPAPHLLGELGEEVDDPDRHQLTDEARDQRQDGHGPRLDHRADDVARREGRRTRQGHAPGWGREERETEQVHRRIREEVARQVRLVRADQEIPRGDAVVLPRVRGGQAPADADDVERERCDQDPGEGRGANPTKEREEAFLHEPCSSS
jgi:hypothetical protein